ncbi:MAG TPA: hypothetical protein VK745_08665 [Polyangiaceae bacterium]|jgi:hypothetical protein|nr:hypothetical protein [Polyangiaceae bacterium]
MARRSKSRASRAERRLLKERAASALKHGLPVPTPPPARVRVPDVLSSQRSSSNPPSASGFAPPNRRMPLAVKLLGIGLLLLGVIYGLTLFRDHHSDADAEQAVPEAPVATSPAPASPATELANPATLEPNGAQSASAAATSVSPISAALSDAPSSPHSVAVASVHVPSGRPPQSAPSAPKSTAALPAAPASAISPVPPATPVLPAVVAPAAAAAAPISAPVKKSAAPTAAPHQVDNPY